MLLITSRFQMGGLVKLGQFFHRSTYVIPKTLTQFSKSDNRLTFQKIIQQR